MFKKYTGDYGSAHFLESSTAANVAAESKNVVTWWLGWPGIAQKKDPVEFMQLHGRRYKIHIDAAIASAADNPSTMRELER
uniref:Uncharacterized protein n=1 Tax=Romanomermis culicivorax TaxID=13658 RepID=A0A915IFP1_ROMCU